MANSALWWWPHEATSADKISFPRTLSDIQLGPQRVVYDASALYGIPLRQDLGGARRIRFVHERLQPVRDATVIQALRSLTTHLQQGHPVSICLDSDKTWGTWARSGAMVEAGDSSILTYGNQFTVLDGTATVANGDEVSIESPNPELTREYRTVSSLSGARLSLGGNVYNTYDLEPVFVRYADFFPVLYLGEDQVDQSHLSQDRRLTWTWDVTLTEYPGAIEALYDSVESLVSETGPKDGALNSLGDAVTAGYESGMQDAFYARAKWGR